MLCGCVLMGVFDKIVNKKVKILQKDGFIKNGIVKDVSDDFITLIFDNGSENLIRKDFIVSITIQEENEW